MPESSPIVRSRPAGRAPARDERRVRVFLAVAGGALAGVAATGLLSLVVAAGLPSGEAESVRNADFLAAPGLPDLPSRHSRNAGRLW